MNEKQELALRRLCDGYHVTFNPDDYRPTFDLPSTWVAGWVGDRIYVGCDPDGRISS